jgi:uncharacterized protein
LRYEHPRDKLKTQIESITMTKLRKYFPLGKAYGKAFCNRVKEIEWLVNNIENAKHSLLVAPRRFGKSSLAEKAIFNTKFNFIKINFHLCTTEEEVSELIVNSVIKLIGATIGRFDKIINSIKKYAANLHPKLSFGNDIISLELIPKQYNNYAVVISESLLLIEKLLREHNKKAIIFFDEFQEVAKIKKSSNLEGAIRTAAQEMQNISIIFSGSIRSLLISMFDDESRPLYKLCRKLKLDRIHMEAYNKHINKVAIEAWGKKLDEEVFEAIMTLSNRHPYYVNYLCDVILEENDSSPTVNQVKKAWEIVVQEEWSDVLKEISMLSLSQRKILKFIATHDIDNILSQETCIKLALPSSTISSATEILIEKDYIELDTAKHYKIINPLLVSVLSNNFDN